MILLASPHLFIRSRTFYTPPTTYQTTLTLTHMPSRTKSDFLPSLLKPHLLRRPPMNLAPLLPRLSPSYSCTLFSLNPLLRTKPNFCLASRYQIYDKGLRNTHDLLLYDLTDSDWVYSVFLFSVLLLSINIF